MNPILDYFKKSEMLIYMAKTMNNSCYITDLLIYFLSTDFIQIQISPVSRALCVWSYTALSQVQTPVLFHHHKGLSCHPLTVTPKILFFPNPNPRKH